MKSEGSKSCGKTTGSIKMLLQPFMLFVFSICGLKQIIDFFPILIQGQIKQKGYELRSCTCKVDKNNNIDFIIPQ